MRKIYYTYAYLREDGTPYYIGKGHADRAYQSQRRKGCPKPTDVSRILFLKKNLTEEEAFKHEVYMIAVLGRKDLGTGMLRNLTDGGEGASNRVYVTSDETKRKLSIAHKGKPLTDAHKKAISKGNKGKHISQSTRNKMRAIHKGRPLSAEHRKKLSDSAKRREARKRSEKEAS